VKEKSQKKLVFEATELDARCEQETLTALIKEEKGQNPKKQSKEAVDKSS
jgi:hypothetical protein